MNSDQYTALCQLIGAQDSPSTTAGELVLVRGLSIGEAARLSGLSYNAAYQAIKARKDALRLIERVSKTKLL